MESSPFLSDNATVFCLVSWFLRHKRELQFRFSDFNIKSKNYYFIFAEILLKCFRITFYLSFVKSKINMYRD